MSRRLTHVIHGANIRMIEGRSYPCFALETLSRSFSLKCLGQNLYRHVAMKSSVPSAIHFAHTAFADCGKDLVRAELFPNYRHEIRGAIITVASMADNERRRIRWYREARRDFSLDIERFSKDWDELITSS